MASGSDSEAPAPVGEGDVDVMEDVEQEGEQAEAEAPSGSEESDSEEGEEETEPPEGYTGLRYTRNAADEICNYKGERLQTQDPVKLLNKRLAPLRGMADRIMKDSEALGFPMLIAVVSARAGWQKPGRKRRPPFAKAWLPARFKGHTELVEIGRAMAAAFLSVLSLLKFRDAAVQVRRRSLTRAWGIDTAWCHIA